MLRLARPVRRSPQTHVSVIFPRAARTAGSLSVTWRGLSGTNRCTPACAMGGSRSARRAAFSVSAPTRTRGDVVAGRKTDAVHAHPCPQFQVYLWQPRQSVQLCWATVASPPARKLGIPPVCCK